MIEDDRKAHLIAHFDGLAPERRRWKKRNHYYYREQERYFRFLVPEGASVLEMGCGTGELLHALRPGRGVGVDISKKMLEIAESRFPEMEFRQADMEAIEAWGETFEYIILSDVIGLLTDIDEAFRKLRPFCRADTRVIISGYNFLWEPVLRLGERIRLKMPQKHQNWLSLEDICNFLAFARFQVVKTDSRLLIPKRFPLGTMINRHVASLPVFRKICLTFYIVARPVFQKKRKDYSTTIVIPCRNEKGNVEAAVRRIPPFGGHQEIIYVEGGSTDGTKEAIERVIRDCPDRDIKILIQEGEGKGDAVRRGFSEAGGDILMILDADLTMPPEDLPKFYRALAEDHGEFVNGCRLVYPMEKQAMRFLNLMGNKFFSLMFTWLLNQRFKDTLCGTKVLFRKDYEKIAENRHYFGNFDPFGDFDLIFGAVKQNLKVVEVPIRYKERTYGGTNIRRFRHGWLLLKMSLFAYRRIKAI